MSTWIVNARGHGSSIYHVHMPQGVINRHSTVLANITEIGEAPGEPRDFPYIGAAAMEIRNIAPRDDGIVDVWVEIDFDTDLDFRMHLIVF